MLISLLAASGELFQYRLITIDCPQKKGATVGKDDDDDDGDDALVIIED